MNTQDFAGSYVSLLNEWKIKNIFVTDEQKLKIHLERNYTERFKMLMKLIRLNKNLKGVKIIEASLFMGQLDDEIFHL